MNMINNITLGSILNTYIPISRFNKGEASKIFDEVHSDGTKIVMKNNKPACVLITPEKYEEIMEMVEDYRLYLEAEKRTGSAGKDDFISHDQILKKLNVSREEIDGTEVEIG